jgi:putative addiction module killer protein
MDNVTQIRETPEFSRWQERLARKKNPVVALIAKRIQRIRKDGYAGDVGDVGEGVSEMRIDHGPGYRVYYVQLGDVVAMLLIGGDKDSQERDIKLAKELAKRERRIWRDSHE